MGFTNNKQDVVLQDQTTEVIDLHLSVLVQDITIVTDTNIDDRIITISSAAEPVNGNMICLKEGTAFYQAEIISHAANGGNWDITLDTPLDFAFTTSGGCSERSKDLNVNGSVTPVTFIVSPANLDSLVKWDITRIIIQMTDSTAMDDGTFGGLPALTNGIVIRVTDGITKNIFNAKTNGDLKAHMYDLQYADKPPAGSGYGLASRRTFSGQDKNGVVIRLAAETEDTFNLIVQDDLTGLDSFQAIVQGHVVEL